MVDIECSAAAPCPNISFTNFDIAPPNGTAPSFVCINAVNVTGLPGKWFTGFWSSDELLEADENDHG